MARPTITELDHRSIEMTDCTHHGRTRAWNELERYRNDPQGYLDKIESE